SALPSMTRRKARRSGTIVSGSYEAFSARQPTTKDTSEGLYTNSRSGALGRERSYLSSYSKLCWCHRRDKIRPGSRHSSRGRDLTARIEPIRERSRERFHSLAQTQPWRT